MKLVPHNSLAVMATVFTLLIAHQLEAGANWPRWRGPQDNGSTAEGKYPATWDPEHVLWKAPLPGKGCSTPVVWEQRIYLTAPTNGHDAVLCFNWDGTLRWLTALGQEDPGKHRNGSGSNPSPADGKLYAAREDGVIFVARVDGKFEVLSEIKMGERTIASIVPIADRLFIRGENNLFCVGSK
jgi:outer membrane protein assembly factor BamB